jgi:hypothetical protein
VAVKSANPRGISEKVLQRQAELKVRFEAGALIAGMILLWAVGIGWIIWFFTARLVPALSGEADTVHRIGLINAYNSYIQAFRNSVNSLEPIDRLFWQAVIIFISSLSAAWMVLSPMDRHAKAIRDQLDNLAKQLSDTKEDLETLRRSVDSLDR